MATFTQLLGLQSGVQAVAQSGDTINFTGFTLTGVSAQQIGDGVGTLAYDGSGNLAATGTGTIDIDGSGALSINSSAGVINIGNDAVNQNVNIATGGTRTVALGSANVTLNVTGGATTLDATTLSIDSTGASNVTATGAALTVSTVTSGDLGLTGADAVNITAGAASTWGITGTLDLDASGAVSINSSGGVINVGDDAVAQAINVGTGAAARTITVGNTTGATSINLDAGTGGIIGEVQDSQAAAFKVGISGDAKNVTLSTASSALALTGVALALQNTNGSSPIAQSYGGKAAAAFTQHHMLTIDATSGEFSTFDCDAGDNLMGTALIAAAAQNDPVVLGIGGILNAVFDTAPAAASIGSIVYALGATGSNQGKVGLTAPTTSGARVWKVGILVAADGAATTTQIQWQPQFLYDVP
jgi:hypothetical protein